jgi:GNAT superfamily N-acetyltransferase
MELVRLKNTSEPYFEKAWKLYEEAFPLEERRTIEQQAFVLQNELYHFDVLIDGTQLIGFILWWNFETHRYIDHFATATEQRNKGLGKLILNTFIAQNDKAILLEVELPTCELNKRRIQFYDRIGFKLNQHHYEIIPSNVDLPSLQLLVMTYPSLISEKELNSFVENYFPILFEKN